MRNSWNKIIELVNVLHTVKPSQSVSFTISLLLLHSFNAGVCFACFYFTSLCLVCRFVFAFTFARACFGLCMAFIQVNVCCGMPFAIVCGFEMRVHRSRWFSNVQLPLPLPALTARLPYRLFCALLCSMFSHYNKNFMCSPVG